MDVMFRLPVTITIRLTSFGKITEIKTSTSHSLSRMLLFVLIRSFVFYFSKGEKKCAFTPSNQFLTCSPCFVAVDGGSML